MFDAFVARGGSFIDTANLYTKGTNERFVGELVAHDRDRFVVATTYTLQLRAGDPNSADNHRESMVTALEASLERGAHYVGSLLGPRRRSAHARGGDDARARRSGAGGQGPLRPHRRRLLPMAASLDLAVTPRGPKPRSYPSSARPPPPSSPTTSARSTSSSPRSTSPVWTPRAAWSWASPRNCSRSIGSATASRATSGAASTSTEVRSAGSYRSDIRGCPSSRRTAGGSPRPSKTHRWASPA